MLKKILGSLLALSLICTVSMTYAARVKEKKIVQHTYYQWCQAIGKAKGDPQVIVPFYAYKATLIPTLSSDFLINKNGGLDAYFKKLTSLPDIRCTPETIKTYIHGDLATNSGSYRFSYLANGKTKTIPARFSFVYKKINGQWKIVNHHSSQMPS